MFRRFGPRPVLAILLLAVMSGTPSRAETEAEICGVGDRERRAACGRAAGGAARDLADRDLGGPDNGRLRPWPW